MSTWPKSRANQNNADENRRLLNQNAALMINIIGSPGPGKTTLLEATLKEMPSYRTAVIEGDLTSEDAQKLAPWCENVFQINTEGAYHLEAGHIGRLLIQENLFSTEFLFIENIGNLVCPAEFDLGEDMRIVVISVTEGNDKPRKYPLSFQNAAAVVVTKMDLLPYCDFSIDTARADLGRINPDLSIFTVSTKSGKGLDEWCRYLETRFRAKKRSASRRRRGTGVLKRYR
ncbi:MAG: hydrogenase nickel incorporation protein HypB [Bacillota bacterium]